MVGYFPDAHQPYVDAVADALREADVAIQRCIANPDPRRNGRLQLGGEQTDTWLLWNEESGWCCGVNRPGTKTVNDVRWAWLGVLPRPTEVVEWFRAGMPLDRPLSQQPLYRSREKRNDGFEEQLQEYASPPDAVDELAARRLKRRGDL